VVPATVSGAASAQLALAGYYILTNRATDAVPILDAIGISDRPAHAAAQTRLAALDYARDSRPTLTSD
jgi:hypothetical protein